MKLSEFIQIQQKTEVLEFSNNAPVHPMVTVAVLIYNHEDYISQCLDSILSQKCDFPFEVLLGEDGSSDGSREICIKYAKEYKDRVRLFLHDRTNIVKIREVHTGRFNFVYNLNSARGKYLALCDGDDYWTDQNKLQKQFEYLENNKDFSLCFHSGLNLYQDDPQRNFVHRPSKVNRRQIFSPRDVIISGGGFITTASMFFRTGYIQDMPDWFFRSPVGDAPLALILAVRGRIGYLDENMCTYRRTARNSWNSRMDLEKWKQHHFSILRMFWEFNKWTNYRYFGAVIIKGINNTIRHLKILLSYFVKGRISK